MTPAATERRPLLFALPVIGRFAREIAEDVDNALYAIVILFTLLVLAQVVFSKGPIGYDKWAGIFSSQWMKVLTFTVILALLYHVWVGMRDIWMDYIKPVWLKLVLDVFTIVWLVACAGWGIQVLWRL